MKQVGFYFGGLCFLLSGRPVIGSWVKEQELQTGSTFVWVLGRGVCSRLIQLVEVRSTQRALQSASRPAVCLCLQVQVQVQQQGDDEGEPASSL